MDWSTGSGPSGGDLLYCLNAATGEIIWKYRTGYTDDAVAVYNGRVYSASDSLYCLDALTGELAWVSGITETTGLCLLK